MACRDGRIRPEELDSRRAREALALYRLTEVTAPHGADFESAFGALWAEFGPYGEMSRREVATGWLDGSRRVERYAWRYHLLIARDSTGATAGARDCHVVVDRERALAVVHLAHTLVLPAHRRRGLGTLFRQLPAVLGRRALTALGTPTDRGDVLLAAEMEPWDAADEASTVRLVAYGGAGFSALDPGMLPYRQPDLRDPGASGRPASPLPLLAVVRWVGRERARALPSHLARALVDCLYAVYASHCRASDLAVARGQTLAVLDASDADSVPLLPLPSHPGDVASPRRTAAGQLPARLAAARGCPIIGASDGRSPVPPTTACRPSPR